MDCPTGYVSLYDRETRTYDTSLPILLGTLKSAKAVFLKHGAQDFRLSQIFTGPYTGQFIVSIVYTDMATYAKVWGNVATELRPLVEANAKLGDVLQEREILMSVEL
jgi:hypothetical protein